MLKIWGRASSTNTQKVIWACEELNIPYDRVDIGGKFGGLDSPAYRALNPNGLIPTIETDGFVLWESHAILRYLAARNPARKLLPDTVQGQAILDQWLDWQMVMLGLRLRTLFMLKHRPQAAPAGETPASANQAVEASFRILNNQLSQTPYIAGASFTIGDIAMGISAHRWYALSAERPKLVALQDWFSRISSRQGFQAIEGLPLI
jgi:glutathione S-transferase